MEQKLVNVQLVKGLPFFRQLVHTELPDAGSALAPLPSPSICDTFFDGRLVQPVQVFKGPYNQLSKDGYNGVTYYAVADQEAIPQISFKPKLSPLECRIHEAQHKYFKNPNALYLRVMAGLTEASKKLQTEPIVDEEGFTKVVGGVAVTSPDGIRVTGFTPKKQRNPDNQFLRLSEKYKPKKKEATPEKLDFYKFQHRERKRKEWESLKLGLRNAEESAARMKKRLRIE